MLKAIKHRLDQITEVAVAAYSDRPNNSTYARNPRDIAAMLREELVGNTYWKRSYMMRPNSIKVTKVSDALNVFYADENGYKTFIGYRQFISYHFPTELEVLKLQAKLSEKYVSSLPEKFKEDLKDAKLRAKFYDKQLKAHKEESK